jgi:hypothetical protein
MSTEWSKFASGQRFLEVKRDLHTITSMNEYQLFECYKSLVKDYTQRILTYQQDALDAFGGILISLRDHLRTEFLLGMPLRYLSSVYFSTRGTSCRHRGGCVSLVGAGCSRIRRPLVRVEAFGFRNGTAFVVVWNGLWMISNH